MSENKKVWFITGSNSSFGHSLTESVLAEGDEEALNTTRQKIENF